MRAAGLLLALSFLTALIASDVHHDSPLWTILIWLVIGFFLAAVVRIHTAVNTPPRRR